MATYNFHPSQIGPSLKGELVVVMPIYNESANIEQVVIEWREALQKSGARYQMLLINDGSKDATLQELNRLEAEDPETLVVVDKFNSGHGRSCRFGYDAAAASEAEWILQIDSDGQCDPIYFETMWSARNNSDCVFGVRTERDDGWARKMTSKICRWSSTLICGVDLIDPNVPYRLIRRTFLAEAIAGIPGSFEIHNVALTYRLKLNGSLRWTYEAIRFRNRQAGVNSINLANVAKLGIDLLFDLWRLRETS